MLRSEVRRTGRVLYHAAGNVDARTICGQSAAGRGLAPTLRGVTCRNCRRILRVDVADFGRGAIAHRLRRAFDREFAARLEAAVAEARALHGGA